MKITKVKYFLVDRKNPSYPIARCSVVIDDVLKLDGLRLYEGAKGKYLAYPERVKPEQFEDMENSANRTHKNEYYHPVERDYAKYFERVIIEGYKKVIESGEFIYMPDDDRVNYKELGVDEIDGEESSEVLQREATGEQTVE
jgi:DNA-binding cell septation regulator SpoVG